MKRTEVLMNKPVCLGLLKRQLSKILIYEFWHDYLKPKYDEKYSYLIDDGSEDKKAKGKFKMMTKNAMSNGMSKDLVN